MVPGVKEARALSALLKEHPIFGQFDIVNVAGDGDEEVENDDALKLVEKAMGDNPEDTRTITLSCGKLTTGVTVRPWSAVMMLAGSHNTDAKAYMQTIFRVQSPYTTNDGRRKENCYHKIPLCSSNGHNHHQLGRCKDRSILGWRIR